VHHNVPIIGHKKGVYFMATIDTNIDPVTGVLTIKVEGHDEIVIKPQDFSETVRTHAMAHGFKQKIGDAAALSRDPATGASATPSQKYFAMQEIVTQLSGPDGSWNRRATGGDGTANAGLLALALFRMANGAKTLDECAAYVKGLDDATQAAMRGDPQVAPVVAQIKLERAARKPAKTATVVAEVGMKLKGFLTGADPIPMLTPETPAEPTSDPVAEPESTPEPIQSGNNSPKKGGKHGRK
jgi:hypothetical protein